MTRLCRMTGLTFLLAFSLMAEGQKAGELFYVSNKSGSDDFDGRAAEPGGNKAGPFLTITQALKQCSVSARIEIANTGIDYRESVAIEGYRKGRADAPLVINGNGATVTGLVVIVPEQWILLKDDIYYFVNKVGGADYKPRGWFDRKIGDSYYGPMPRSVWLRNGHQGWFTRKEAPLAPQIFLVDGKPGENVTALEELPPGGFFFDSQAKTLPEPAGQPVLYFRLPENRKLADCRIEMPLNSGIFAGDDYTTVENIGSCYSVEDGFDGFWGQSVVFHNVHAFNNTEQGMSFHGNGSSFIDGALIEHNGGCGIVDVMSSTSIYRNVTVRNNYPNGADLRGASHAMYNCRIIGNSGTQVTIFPGTATAGSLINCLIVGNGPKEGWCGVDLNYGRIDHCTVINCPVGVRVTTGAAIKNSIITDCPTTLIAEKNAMAQLTIDKTILGLGEASFGGQKITAPGWAEFIKTFKGAEGAIVDNPKLESPLFLLPQDSPHCKSGEEGTMPGAKLPPFTKWMYQEPR